YPPLCQRGAKGILKRFPFAPLWRFPESALAQRRYAALLAHSRMKWKCAVCSRTDSDEQAAECHQHSLVRSRVLCTSRTTQPVFFALPSAFTQLGLYHFEFKQGMHQGPFLSGKT